MGRRAGDASASTTADEGFLTFLPTALLFLG
jgi:hypothetical protein